jgi:hypothetical protein
MTLPTNDLVGLAEAVNEGVMSQADAEARLRSDSEIAPRRSASSGRSWPR